MVWATMCGRFTLHTPAARIREAFALGTAGCAAETGELRARYNIAPSQDVAIVRAGDAGRELAMVRWGLVPHWSKEPQTKYATINARIESVAEKPAYRTAFRQRRCLVPADGYYEWRATDGVKVPYHIRRPDGDVFAFAGLWERWEGDGRVLESCTLIVMPSSAGLRPLHARMPAIIDPANYDAWLDRGITHKQDIMACLDARSAQALECFPVSRRVNSPANDDARCIQPVDAAG